MQSIEKMAGDGPHPPELMMMMMIEHRRPFSLVLGGDFIIIMPSYINIYIYPWKISNEFNAAGKHLIYYMEMGEMNHPSFRPAGFYYSRLSHVVIII